MDIQALITDHLAAVSDPLIHPAITSLMALIFRSPAPTPTALSKILEQRPTDMTFYSQKAPSSDFRSDLDTTLHIDQEISDTAAVAVHWRDRDTDERGGDPLCAFHAIEMMSGNLLEGPFINLMYQENDQEEPEEEFSKTDFYIEKIAPDTEPLPMQADLDDIDFESGNIRETELLHFENGPDVQLLDRKPSETDPATLNSENSSPTFHPTKPCNILSPQSKSQVLKSLNDHCNRPNSADFVQTAEDSTPLTTQQKITFELQNHIAEVTREIINKTLHIRMNSGLISPLKQPQVLKLLAQKDVDSHYFFATSQIDIPTYYNVYQEATGFFVYSEIKDQVLVLANRYVIVEPNFNDDGQFGLLMVAYDVKNAEFVAVKMCKNVEYFQQLLNEIRTLIYINSYDSVNNYENFALLKDYFMQFSTLFIVFEFLGDNLYQIAQKSKSEKERKVVFNLNSLKKITQKIVQSVNFLGSLGILHFDLKPENIVIKNIQQPGDVRMVEKEAEFDDYAKVANVISREFDVQKVQNFPDFSDFDVDFDVKLIDIGSHQFFENGQTPYVQSRFYRAPEVFLKIPFDGRTETFSLGCVLYELLTSKPLFVTHVDCANYAHQLASFIGLLGPIPEWMILQGQDSHLYFTEQYELFANKDALVEGYYDEFGDQTVEEIESIDGLYVILKPLKKDIRELIQEQCKELYDVDELSSDMRDLVDFIASCLELDMNKRMFPEELVKMNWIAK
ncbi:Kinase, CMGC CLK [Spironucleus salmonicida]|uniref:Kinase, CMGC CLK n=1 Tax=Spironucleus salmonicida TaxID=348837 RepID=V6LFR3_9EUKA|nr:Kinase, CMGC CLK [Spironucleus salmonicida]|eukprot:EST43385.1 Kinase, CMGC CLK [Spironucleus salmonicida]